MVSHDINFAINNASKILHLKKNIKFFGNTEDYAFCVYSEDDGEYILGGITTELDLEDLDEDDDMYFYYAVTTRMINEYYDNGIEIGSINAERFNAVLKNAAYGSVKIIQ